MRSPPSTLYIHVADHWPAHLGDIPEDPEQAIDAYYGSTGAVETRQIKPAPIYALENLKGKRR
ncbi:MAG: hypothetical protein HS126_22145 [Anaerolineales bacterium]|nr:hypothetical protein [Anaerolineales bacterium]